MESLQSQPAITITEVAEIVTLLNKCNDQSISTVLNWVSPATLQLIASLVCPKQKPPRAYEDIENTIEKPKKQSGNGIDKTITLNVELIKKLLSIKDNVISSIYANHQIPSRYSTVEDYIQDMLRKKD